MPVFDPLRPPLAALLAHRRDAEGFETRAYPDSQMALGVCWLSATGRCANTRAICRPLAGLAAALSCQDSTSSRSGSGGNPAFVAQSALNPHSSDLGQVGVVR